MKTEDTDDYAGDQPQGPGPDDDASDPSAHPAGREPGARRRPPRPEPARGYFRWLLESAAATPRLM